MFFLGPARADSFQRLLDVRLQRLVDFLVGVAFEAREVKLSCRHFLGDLLRREACGDYGVAYEIQNAAPEQPLVLYVCHEHVGQRNGVLVDAVDAEQTAECAFHRYGGVLVYKLLDITRDVACHVFGVSDLVEVET